MLTRSQIDGIAEDAGWRTQWSSSLEKVMRLQNVPVLLMSGTIPKEFEGELWEKLGLSPDGSTPLYVRVLRESTQRLNISYQVANLEFKSERPGKDATDEEKTQWFEEWVTKIQEHVEELSALLNDDERGIIFFSEREFTQQVADRLGLPVITGDSKQADRDQIWAKWHAGNSPIICTNKAGYYGVDFPHVGFTLHVDWPRSMLDFAQSSGRAGRGGQIALSLVLLPFITRKPSKREAGMEETFGGTRVIKDLLRSEACYRVKMAQFLDGAPQSCANLAERHGVEAVAWCGNCTPTEEIENWEARWDYPYALGGMWFEYGVVTVNS